MTSLDGLGFGVEPLLDPLCYPGKAPETSGLLINDEYLRIEPRVDRRLGQALVFTGDTEIPGFGDPCVPLNYGLLVANVASIDARIPVVAVGSNASPVQLRRKFVSRGASQVVPMTRCVVDGISVAHSAHVSAPGYMAATPRADPGHSHELFVTWLDTEQLSLLDETEPNYHRVALDPGRHAVTLQSGEVLSRCFIYTSKCGVLAVDGTPVALTNQTSLLESLLARSPWLQQRVGSSAAAWVSACRGSEDLRAEIRGTIAREGWVAASGIDHFHAEGDARYGRAPSRLRAPAGSFVVDATPDDLDRNGEPCIIVSTSTWKAFGCPTHASVTPTQPKLPTATVRMATAAPDQNTELVGVDQVVRNAVGCELGESVFVHPATIAASPLADRLIAPRRYLTCRVQSADLLTVEQEAALVEQLILDLLGIESGDEVVIEGAPDDGGRVPEVRVKAFHASDEILDRRRNLHGGGFDSRFPSARDALGVFPDLTWVFLDSALRTRLGLSDQTLGCVRIRASRRGQVAKELRELLLLLMLAFIGLLSIIESARPRLIALAAVSVAILLSVGLRLRSRMIRRVRS